MQDTSGRSTRSKRPPKGWLKARRVTAYQAPPSSRFRRIFGWILSPWLITGVMLIMLAAGITLAYFWVDYSDRIDRKLLSGEVFTPTAGIYSAPKYVRAGDATTLSDLVEYLKTAGYI